MRLTLLVLLVAIILCATLIEGKKKKGSSEEKKKGSSEEKKKVSSEEKKKGSSEEKKKGSSEEKKKGSSEEKKTGSSEEKKKGSSEEKKKGSSEEKKKGSSEEKKKGSSEEKKKGSSEEKKKGSSEEKKKGSSEEKKKGSSEEKKKGSSEEKKKGSSEEKKKGSSEEKKKGSSEEKKKGSSEEKKKGSSEEKKKGSSEEKKKGSSEEKKKGSSEEKKKGSSEEKKKKGSSEEPIPDIPCPLNTPDLANTPPGCEYEESKDENGCSVWDLICEENKPEPTEFLCPLNTPDLANTPPGCEYEESKDENGCSVWDLVCEENKPEPTEFLCPLNTPDLANTPPGCEYEESKDENGCSVWDLVCEDDEKSKKSKSKGSSEEKDKSDKSKSKGSSEEKDKSDESNKTKGSSEEKSSKDKSSKSKSNGSSEEKKEKGCYMNDKVYKKKEKWISGDFQYQCKKSKNRYDAKKIACVLPDGRTLYTTMTIGDVKYTCEEMDDGDRRLVKEENGKKTTKENRPASDFDADCRLAFCSVKRPDTRPYCKGSGDPHIYTFDGKKHNYQGTCKQTVVEPLSPVSTPFKVSMKTEHRDGKNGVDRGSGARVSFIKWLEIKVYGQVIRLGKNGVITVNGATSSVPFIYPQMPDDVCDKDTASCKVNVVKSGSKGLLLNTDFGLTVFFDGNHRMQIAIPKSLLENTGGTCGFYDNNRANDWRLPNGTVVDRYNIFGDSWTEPDEEDPNCQRFGDTEEEECKGDTEADAKAKCSPLLDPNGPFAACHKNAALAEAAKAVYDSCLFDTCAFDGNEEVRCAEMSAFAAQCQEALSTVNDAGVTTGPLIVWRSAKLCPPTCDAGQHFEACASACTPTCLNPNPTCTLPCVQDCVCDQGTVLDNGKCIPVEQCGCIDSNQVYRSVGDTWTSSDCSGDCNCKANGEIECQQLTCDAPFTCSVEDGNHKCKCEKGYKANADGICDDVDECTDMPGLCGPNSVCTNTPGSYKCDCLKGHKRMGEICEFVDPPPTTPPPQPVTPEIEPEPTTLPPKPTTPPEKLCPEAALEAPPEGCHYNQGVDDQGCPTHELVCEKKGPTEPPCPPNAPNLAFPPPGCTYEVQEDDKGCPEYILVCKDGTTVIPIPPTTEPPRPTTPPEPICPEVTLLPAPQDCFYEEGVDVNGCPTHDLVCASKVTTEHPCPLNTPDLANPPPGCTYEVHLDDAGCSVYNLVCATTLPPRPTTPACPQVTMMAPPAHCTYEQGVDVNGCPTYDLVCDETVTTAVPCPPNAPDLANPPAGCSYEVSQDDDGCSQYKLICLTTIPPPQPTTPSCPLITQMAPPEHCMYEEGVDVNGCPTYDLVCDETVTTAVPCPPNAPDLANPPPGCSYDVYQDDDGCSQYRLICATTMPPPPTTPVCPQVTMMAPPDHCVYEQGVDVHGCATYDLVCDETVTTAAPCPPNAPDLANPPAGCSYEVRQGDDGCPVYNLICAATTVPPQPDDECDEGFEMDDNGVCTDVDECESGDVVCMPNEECLNKEGSYKCACVPEYSRDLGGDCRKIECHC